MSYDVTRATLRGMTHIPPPAEELRFLDAELRQLDARRAQLLVRRAWLLTSLQPVRPNLPTPAGPPRPETTAPGVQNVLLLLGGILLTVAAMVFTLVSWGHLGIGGRAAVLGAVTLAALGAPVALLRRGLRSTAESVAGLGLALTVLDAYALHEAAFPTADGVTYAAAASTLLAAVWTAYGVALAALPGPTAVRLPLPAALVCAQLPLALWAVASGGGPHTVTAAVLLTAAFDTVVALRVSGRSLRLVAAGGAFGTGGWGVLATGLLSLDAAGPGAAARAAALFALATAIALGAAWFAPRPALATGTAVAGGLFLVAGAGGVLRAVLPGGWTVLAYLACGVALLAAVRGPVAEPVRRGLALASGAVQACAVLWALPAVGVALLGPVAWVPHAWSGAPADAPAAATVDGFWPAHAATAPLVLAAVAAVLALAVRDVRWRPQALTAALVLAWATVLVLPAALELPYTVGLLVQGLATVAVLGFATPVSTGLAVLGSAGLALLSLATETGTLVVLGSLTVLFAVAAWRRRLAPVSASVSLVYATGLACAVGASLGLPPQHTALLVLAVPTAAALVAPRVGGTPVRVAVEATGAAAALVAVGLTLTDPPLLSLVLALCAVIAAGTAVRPDRRPAGYAATALFVLATWVRLAAWGITAPEAYTLPAAVPALVVGALRRRRDPGASSWTAYGPGLAAGLVPSLFAAWGDAHWIRPLLLGAAALLVTLLGARHRLQAPLALGGTVLSLDALHELAPYLVQVTDALPRWVPPALAGLLLLALGATYEQRLRDVRRVREVLGRMN
ncbi:SCO7613 C-terminal domain-containing membrane protein [Streptomyces sp. NPDC087903]|uniref:SCO7613 C-terminal domain-containing membrane protein n=1 Tax=Streptomyces sp. NPDC087903 TaxID=3365819 RepID=UPI00382E0A62